MRSNKRSDTPARTSRRRFTRNVAAALVAAPFAPSLVHAQAPAAKQAPQPPKPQPSPSPAAPKPSPAAEAYTEVVRARFGDHLTPAQLDQIKKDVDGNVRAAERLRAIKLKNGDEPDFIFSAT